MSTKKTETYAEHFQNLTQIAEELENEKNPDVDILIEKVKKGLQSHDFCRARIEAATKELDKLFKTESKEK